MQSRQRQQDAGVLILDKERFSARAAAYSKFRPTYPTEAIDFVLEGLAIPVRAADLGAGTGISSRMLAERDVAVIAVEPNDAMRAEAPQHPLVVWAKGSAEDTGLAAQSVDLVTAFQAFHWFDASHAFAEMQRVSRRRAALVQYERDESSDFTRAYGDTVRLYATDATEARRLQALSEFRSFPGARVLEEHCASSQALNMDELLGRAASASYLPQTGGAGHALRARLRDLFGEYQRDGCVELQMTIFVLTADFN
ncbi:MAG: class I SAM-dependent methyltransferase [Candidatus Eremiobacteraeota bacterium]|nr:class I SAM-dependent methyltransferase [Candidatus Eremiobacteraeota bacterium]